MQFTVPKFIDMEPKIVGPLTLKQFFFVFGAVVVIFIVYVLGGKNHLFWFIVLSVFLLTGALLLIYAKPGGLPLPVLLKNIFSFSRASKFFLFRRKSMPPKLMQQKKEIKKPEEKEMPEGLKVIKKGLLHKLSTQIQIKSN